MKVNYINTYSNIYSPKVENEIDVYTFFETISNPNSATKRKINTARYHYTKGDKSAYENIKFSLPCYTLNFSFNDYKKNENIKGSTGLIYIDVDNNTNINFHNEYIYATWRSLSNSGRGILVKAHNLTLTNFKHNYGLVSELIGIKADKNAGKPTQYNIQSYDSDLYVNDNSKIYKAESVTSTTIINNDKKIKDITESSTFGNIQIRYNTIDEYDFSDNDYIFFPDKKEDFYEIFIPKLIPDGKRNQTVFAIGCQFRGINVFVSHEQLLYFLNYVNMFCKPSLKEHEIKRIAKNIFEIKDITPKNITPRRILFNPKSKLTKQEKIKISNKKNGERKSKETQENILRVINSWDEEKDGKMNNTSIAKKIGISRATVSRHLKKNKK